jgi:hypothetical protein
MRPGLGMGSLHLWAREDNPQGYSAYLNNRIYPDVVACDGSHNALAAIAHKVLGRQYVCATADGKHWFKFNGALWVEDRCRLNLRKELSSTLRAHFLTAVNKLLFSMSEDDLQSNASTTTTHAHKHLMNIALQLRNKVFKTRCSRS